MEFPFASAPEIIRANQKDTFIDLNLREQLRELVQWAKGVRFVHAHSTELESMASFLYLGLTTLLGTRTLGEEYTDLIYLTSRRQLPSWKRKAAFVLAASFGPSVLHSFVSNYRSALLARINPASSMYSVIETMNISTLVTLNLTLFYFAGSYYQLSKRLFGLRYAFGHRVDPSEPRGTYEFLGLLLVIRGVGKLANKMWTKLNVENSATQLAAAEPGLDLDDDSVLPFIPAEARSCNLCLESVKDPAVTLCGHMFCWSCISEWCRDQSECPLCRQKCDEQNLLLLQV